MILAGGETTSAALSSTLFYLSRNKASYERLNDEVRGTFSSLESIRQGPLLSSCDYLRACLDEALRLTPPTPDPLWRKLGPGGAMINGQHVPEGYEVAVDLYAIHHNQIYFPDADVFDPDRFMAKSAAEPTIKKPKFDYFPTSRANTIFPTSPSAVSPNSFQGMYFPSPPCGRENPAFAPFLLGPRSCVGKPLAYMEMSLTLARLMWCMDFRAAEPLNKEQAEDTNFGSTFGDPKGGNLLQSKKREELNL